MQMKESATKFVVYWFLLCQSTQGLQPIIQQIIRSDQTFTNRITFFEF